MKIEHISVSRQNTYNQCPQNYKYKYHLNVISPEPEPVYFAYGKMVHKIIEEYTRGRGNLNINDIINDVLNGRIEIEKDKDPPKLSTEYKRKLPKHIANFMKLTDQIGTGGDLEWKFRYDLDPPNGRHCTGFIDRLIRKDDKIFIIDYKTTKAGPWRKESHNITTDLQLQCYCWVAMKEFGLEPCNIKAALYYLEDGLLVPAKFSRITLESIPQRLLSVYKDIENSHPDKVKGNVGSWCERCDYRSICPYYRAI